MITIEMNRLDKNGNLPKDQETYMCFSGGGKWVRGWMKDTLKLRSPQYRTEGSVRYAWIVPKSKKNLAVKEALAKDSQVVVFQTFNKTVKCTSSCKTAMSLIEECECSCIGKFHGGRNTDGDGTELQATVSMPDFSLHIHGKYVTMRTEYRDGQVISRMVQNDAGVFVDVSDEYPITKQDEYPITKQPEPNWSKRIAAAKAKDSPDSSPDGEHVFCEDVMMNRACSCGECSTYLAEWD